MSKQGTVPSYWEQDTEQNLSSIVGKVAVKVVRDASEDELVTIRFSDGTSYAFIHRQDCCESVSLDDVDGDLSDLVGDAITLAEEVRNTTESPKDKSDAEYGSFTWTFYRLATGKGYVTLKFYGTSNGYYSEEVDFMQVA